MALHCSTEPGGPFLYADRIYGIAHADLRDAQADGLRLLAVAVGAGSLLGWACHRWTVRDWLVVAQP